MTSKLPTPAEVATSLKPNLLGKECSLPPLTTPQRQYKIDDYALFYDSLDDSNPLIRPNSIDMDAIYIYDSDEDLSMYDDDPTDSTSYGDPNLTVTHPSSFYPRSSTYPTHPTREGLLDWQFRQGLLSYSHLIVPQESISPSHISPNLPDPTTRPLHFIGSQTSLAGFTELQTSSSASDHFYSPLTPFINHQDTYSGASTDIDAEGAVCCDCSALPAIEDKPYPGNPLTPTTDPDHSPTLPSPSSSPLLVTTPTHSSIDD